VFIEAFLPSANFENANAMSACFAGAQLSFAVFDNANLADADFRAAQLQGASFRNSNLTGAWVHGAGAWDVKLDGAIQKDLVLSPKNLSDGNITVDNLEIAYIVDLMLSNKKFRDVIDTLTTKIVLILGRFTPERKEILDALREELRLRNYVSVLFDFDKPDNRSTVETVATLALLSRFIIADLSAAKSILQELQHIVPQIPSIPVKPLIIAGELLPGMLDHIQSYRSFLSVYEYTSKEDLLHNLDEKVITPALEWKPYQPLN
jgi:uncharacterized protein YjbI with pentapeptide repeats